MPGLDGVESFALIDMPADSAGQRPDGRGGQPVVTGTRPFRFGQFRKGDRTAVRRA